MYDSNFQVVKLSKTTKNNNIRFEMVNKVHLGQWYTIMMDCHLRNNANANNQRTCSNASFLFLKEIKRIELAINVHIYHLRNLLPNIIKISIVSNENILNFILTINFINHLYQ